MDEQLYAYEQEHNAFINYLMERFDGDMDEVTHVVETAERIIPNTLNGYFNSSYNSIYELQEINEVEEYRRKIKVHPILKGIDSSEEPRYTEVLKWYRLWLKSQLNNSVPFLTPAEYKVLEEGKVSKLSERKILKKQHSTIFLEGEAGEAQETVYRQRNMELREACIDYFRMLHDGHIVCECCGFEFAAQYDIDDDYIEIHHRFPFSHTDGEHEVNSETDLVPLCANCHRMIHHGMGGKGNCMTLDELKNKYKGIRYNNQ